MKRLLLTILALILLLGACGKKEDDPEESGILPIDNEEFVSDDEVVVTVNDEEVLGNTFNLVYVQTKIQLYNFGEDVEDVDEVKELSLETVVEQELLRQNAQDKGITFSEEDVSNKFEELMDDGDGQVKQFLADYHLDEEAFKEQVSYSLYLDEYLQQEISVNVSEDDITEMYAQIKEQSEDAPDLDEIKGDIEEQIKNQKQQQQMLDILDTLKEDATIETHI
ncbi:MAG TPA: SurA N-terminal domain-containing protein [Bacillota bacterium]|nr:SurA N-terminal domain-containing protein [Bacillota bacterium]